MVLESRPWICDAEVGKTLGISEGCAIFRRMYTHYSTDNRILAFVESFATANVSIRELKIEW